MLIKYEGVVNISMKISIGIFLEVTLFLNTIMWRNFHTGIPVWVPKFCRPKKGKGKIHFFTLILCFKGNVSSI